MTRAATVSGVEWLKPAETMPSPMIIAPIRTKRSSSIFLRMRAMLSAPITAPTPECAEHQAVGLRVAVQEVARHQRHKAKAEPPSMPVTSVRVSTTRVCGELTM